MATEDSYFILSVNTEMIQAAIEAKQPLGDDGLEEAFDVSQRFLSFKRVITDVGSLLGIGRSE